MVDNPLCFHVIFGLKKSEGRIEMDRSRWWPAEGAEGAEGQRGRRAEENRKWTLESQGK
jgi:hypothetical protein